MILRDILWDETSSIGEIAIKEVLYREDPPLATFVLLAADPGEALTHALEERLSARFSGDVRLRWEEIEAPVVSEEPLAPVREEGSVSAMESYYQEPVQVEPLKEEKPEVEEGALIFGKFGKKDVPVALDQVRLNARVVIAGKIVTPEDKIEEIVTKTGALILRFDVTDREGHAVGAKVFAKEDEVKTARALFQKNKTLRFRGQLQYDEYAHENLFVVRAAEPTELPFPLDTATQKRVELAVHTQVSTMEGTIDVSDLVARLTAWGHDAVGITDVGSLQSYPLIAKAAKKKLKVLYGYQAKVLNEEHRILSNPFAIDVAAREGSFTVFDLETTGFSRYLEEIIEIGAIRYENGKKVGEFSQFVNPRRPIPPHITELTSITDMMVQDADPIEVVLPAFLEFAKDSILVAHNAAFDVGFVREKARKLGLFCEPIWIDTLGFARALHPDFRNHKLDTLTKELHVPLVHHHRAIDDATATGFVFLSLWQEWRAMDLPLEQINRMPSAYPLAKHESSDLLVYCPKQSALKRLYEMVSDANVNYFAFGRPGVPMYSLLQERGDLLLASGFVGSDLFRMVAESLPEEILIAEAKKMDVLVVQPDDFMEAALNHELVADRAHYQSVIERIIALGEALEKPVMAIGMPAYLDPGERRARNVLVNYQRNLDFDRNGRCRLKTTEEMLDGFAWLPEEKRRQIVIAATQEFAAAFEDVLPVPEGTHAPELDGAAEELRTSSLQRAEELYGSPLPPLVQARLDRELGSIIKNGFSSLYVIARRLVKKSESDGYLVGSRGSVGSSFVATMSGITEVNPLVPHYVCPDCKHSEFIEDGSVESGFDLPPKNCPVCGAPMRRDGHTIPFEVFLGFDGDKEPDIDLNFAGEYMATIHKYTEELFGEGKVFRAGTISGVKAKTAYGLIRKYQEQAYAPDEDQGLSDAEIRATQVIMMGTKRTTGQHPGGLMIVPKEMDITDVTPIQYPADDVKSEALTTHFSFKDLDHCLLKLDELGHTSPSIIRQLEELSGINPLEIAFNDPATMSIFSSATALEAKASYSNETDGSLGIPELGTNFVRGMLHDTKPSTFGALCRISGLSHGTDVWNNNAQDLILGGTTNLRGAICTRDDIMNYLILQGVDNLVSFKTMEAVRKGKGIPAQYLEEIQAHEVPEWYIKSCQKIQYLFPKAHATAYVMMSYRIAWFKVHQPAAFYATYFTQHLNSFSSEYLVSSLEEAQHRMKLLLEAKARGTKIDTDKWYLWELVEEMYARGVRFQIPDLYRSKAASFASIGTDVVLAPFAALDDVSEANGLKIVEERKKGDFISRDDLKKRAGLTKNGMLSMSDIGLLDGMQKSNQMSFF